MDLEGIHFLADSLGRFLYRLHSNISVSIEMLLDTKFCDVASFANFVLREAA